MTFLLLLLFKQREYRFYCIAAAEHAAVQYCTGSFEWWRWRAWLAWRHYNADVELLPLPLLYKTQGKKHKT